MFVASNGREKDARPIMTLKEFLRAADAVPGPELRRAMVRALAAEPARTAAARRRFYARVVDQLALVEARSAARAQAGESVPQLAGRQS